MGARKRIFMYSHDSYGLGHLRRCMLLASELSRAKSPPAVLIATGSPRAQAFDMPDGCDTLKLPAVTKSAAGGYQSRSLDLSLEEMVRLRTGILSASLRTFDPDVVLIDHSPGGLGGELVGPLTDLAAAQPRPLIFLGLRDIVDEATRVQQEWARAGVWPLLEDVYDRVLVYGDESVTTTATEIELQKSVSGGVLHVGYLGRSIPKVTERSRAILVTTGGGGDGQGALRAFAEYLERRSSLDFESIVVTGPFLSREREAELTGRFNQKSVRLIRFMPGVENLMGTVAGVISMAGYNSVVEILSARVPALLIPRTEPRLEQKIRAERIASRADLVIGVEDTVSKISSFVERVLEPGYQTRSTDLNLQGLLACREELAA